MKYQLKQPHTIMHRAAPLFIIALSCLTIVGLVLYGPISQDPSYHNFADYQTLLSLPNFWNVVSNFPFIIVGIIGLYKCKTMHNDPVKARNRTSYILFFIGVLFTGISSAYYHLQPNNWGLFWDRLSMALSFVAFLSIVISEFIGSKLSKQLMAPFVLFGLFSVVYWIVTEQYGTGDLRPYVITQFLPIFIGPVVIFSWKSESIKTSDIVIIGACYGIAKLLEFFDTQVYQAVMISGHSLKHLAATFSAYWMLSILGRYQRKATPSQKL